MIFLLLLLFPPLFAIPLPLNSTFIRTYHSLPSPSPSPDPLSRHSIFSIIHPALAAALATENTLPTPLPQPPPLTNIQYHSAPLKATGDRDRQALGLHPFPKTPVASNQPQIHTYTPIQQVPKGEHRIQTLPSEVPDTSVTTLSSNPHLVENPSQHPPIPVLSQSHEKPSKVKPQPAVKPTFWQRVNDNIRHVINSVLLHPSPQNSTIHSHSSSSYSEQDIQQMVHDIMIAIQLNPEQIHAHREMLSKTHRWEDTGDTNPVLIMKNRVMIQPTTLANLITQSAKQVLGNKVSNNMSAQIQEAVRREIHTLAAN